ncbi:MAG: U32 family peptidase, partial [Hespellia sp.]|nr:U32 family peptidase [Hespellia sp.]
MMEKENSVEILAPAGTYESFRAALSAGADAVYLGGNHFGARAFAQNFTEEELLQAIDEAHLHGRRVYLTVNTLLKEEELSNQLFSYLRPLYCQGLDAVIVQDLGVLRCVRRWFPDLELHASTQMTVTGRLGASFLKEYGVKRVVPARELSIEEIREIKAKTGLEIECFVHGALCYCYSGQCLLSSLIGGRSGNRGQCAQPCRLPYLFEGRKGYLLSLKDICTLDLIPELVEAGIDSFKIEGRMKKPEYVAGVVSMYRKYVDLFLQAGKKNYQVAEEDRERLMDLYNRGGFHEGYYHTQNGPEMVSLSRPNHAGTPAARVTAQKGREIEIQALKTLEKGDILEIPGAKGQYPSVPKGKEDRKSYGYTSISRAQRMYYGVPFGYTLGKKLKNGECHRLFLPKREGGANSGYHVSKGTILFRTRSASLIERLQTEYIDRKIQEKIYGFLKLFPQKPATLELSWGDRYLVVSGEVVQSASKQPLSEERVRKQMEKTGDMPFRFEKLEISMASDAFYPMQQLNALRREAARRWEEEITGRYRRVAPKSEEKTESSPEYVPSAKRWIFAVSVETWEQLECLREFDGNGRVYVDCGLLLEANTTTSKRSPKRKNVQEALQILQGYRTAGWQVYLAFPFICREQSLQKLRLLTEQFASVTDGALVRNLESIQLLKEMGF